MSINPERRIIQIFLLVSLCVTSVHAQYDPSYAHYFDMETSFNPASAGKDAKLNVTAAYALDLAGFEHNPRTMYAAADMPFRAARMLHGVGVQFQNDAIGLFTHQRLSLQYAYKRHLLGGTLSLGVQAGIISEKFDGSKVDTEEGSDPAFSTSDIDGNGFDFAAGLYYARKDWYIGLSALHLNSPKIEMGERSELQIDPTYYFTAGYTFHFRNPYLSFKPSTLVRYDGSTWRGDIGGRLVYTHEQKMLYGGASYSPDNSVTVLLGGKFHGIVLGYSYEVYTSSLNPGNGSHEIFLGYQMDIDLNKKGRNFHQSVRFL